jgi:hypothetical protein
MTIKRGKMKIIMSISCITFLLISILLFQMSCESEMVTVSTSINDRGYPRLAMWWPDTWEQPIDDLKRYEWIGFGQWDNISTIGKLKSVNPDQKHFMDYSITETSWSSWENNRIIMQKIPSEWFLTQRGTYLAQPLDRNQTTVYVESVLSKNGKALFEINDIVTCDFESMKVTGIDEQNKTLTVERGFVRAANPHLQGSRIAPQITFWPTSWVMNMSTLCPKVDINDGNGPQNWIEFACRNKKIENEDLWDGYITDRIEETQSWLIPGSCRNIDPDCSNKEVTDDYAVFDAAWYEGCAGYLEYLRSVYPDKALIANSFGTYYQQLNGCIYEGFPTNWNNSKPETYEEWSYRALGEQGYLNVSKSGHSPNYSLGETYEDEEGPKEGDLYYNNPFDHPDFVPNYQRMRYGLTSTLLGDGYFSYEINTNGHGSLGLMWFDEYDNAGKTRGYLGMPIKEAITIMQAGDGSVWRRDYEKGIVICNPTNVTIKVDLGNQYRLIKGNQVPEINSGELVNNISILARDGRILLKE